MRVFVRAFSKKTGSFTIDSLEVEKFNAKSIKESACKCITKNGLEFLNPSDISLEFFTKVDEEVSE